MVIIKSPPFAQWYNIFGFQKELIIKLTNKILEREEKKVEI